MAQYANYLKRDFVSHTRRVQDLFKRIVRNEESFVRDKGDIKFIWATVRGEFEKHRNVQDLRNAKLLLEEGERKLFLHLHPKPKKFLFSPGGLMYEREAIYPDGHLDLWHPLEKAQYPHYFAKREARKKELVAMWERNQSKNSGPPKDKAEATDKH